MANLVDVWHSTLDLPEGIRGSLADTLSRDERERAGRFLLPEDARRWELARGILRDVVSRYCNATAASLRFDIGPHGKPALALTSSHESAPGLEFNLSHCADRVVVAVTRAGPVGVDIESRARRVRVDTVARRFFAPEEVDALMRLPAADRERAFLTAWARKEAYVKAHGDGLWHPLDAFVVTMAPNDPPAIVSTREGSDDPRAWALHDLDLGPGHVAALAIRSTRAQVRCHEWGAEEIR